MQTPERRVGAWLMVPDPIVVEVTGRAGFSWVGLDLQHGGWDLRAAFTGIQLLDALDVPVLVRISEDDLPLMPRLLDHGAAGIVVAMVSSADTARAAVRAARYQPLGTRSYGGQRFGMRHEPADLTSVQPMVFAMIEDRRGLDQVEEIAAVDGLAGLHVGPFDLALGLGLGRDQTSPAFAVALARIRDAARRSRIISSLHAVAADRAGACFDDGWDEIVIRSDVELLRQALRIERDTAFGGVAPQAASPAP
jgi:4-hydroxy-2-oxoheptanedioate aldolase